MEEDFRAAAVAAVAAAVGSPDVLQGSHGDVSDKFLAKVSELI